MEMKQKGERRKGREREMIKLVNLRQKEKIIEREKNIEKMKRERNTMREVKRDEKQGVRKKL